MDSYPYLAFSREWNLNYGEVLTMASKIAGQTHAHSKDAPRHWSIQAWVAFVGVVRKEECRQRRVTESLAKTSGGTEWLLNFSMLGCASRSVAKLLSGRRS